MKNLSTYYCLRYPDIEEIICIKNPLFSFNGINYFNKLRKLSVRCKFRVRGSIEYNCKNRKDHTNLLDYYNYIKIYRLILDPKISVYIEKNYPFLKIPKNVFNFTSLKVLDISENSIRKIPEKIINLVNLENLIANNNLIRRIPKNLSKLRKLINVDLTYNRIKHITREFADIDLFYLDLSYNYIEKLPKNFNKDKYIHFRIDYNKLECPPVGDPNCVIS